MLTRLKQWWKVRQDSRKMTKIIRRELGARAGKPFTPEWHYQMNFDVLTVLTEDCSYTQGHLIRFLRILTRNHMERPVEEIVGFEIDCPRAFCIKYGLPTEKVEIRIILDKIVEVYPETLGIVLILKDLLDKTAIKTVSLPPSLHAVA